MDERTIPASEYWAQKTRAPQPPQNADPKAWGDDFHYRALYEQSDDCIFIISLDLRYMATNPQALELLGYTENELIGKPVSDIMTMDACLGNAALLDDNSNLFERILRRKDGSTIPVEISTSIVHEGAGVPAYIQSIARDISKRKAVDLALNRHNRILLSTSAASTHLLQSTKIEETIAEVLNSLGQAAGAVACFIIEIKPGAGRAAICILSGWQKDKSVRMDINSILAPHQTAILEQEGIFAENVEIPPTRSVAIVPMVGGSAEARKFLGLFYPEPVQAWLPAQQDAVQIAGNLIGAAIQRNLHEEAILKSEARNRSIINALPDLIIRMDERGQILDYSAQPNHRLYRPRDEVTGKLLYEIWPQEIARRIMGDNHGEAFTESHQLTEFNLPFNRQTYEARLAPIAAHEALLVIRDITEQAKLNEMKSDFINRASHELRTPLTTVIMMTDLIQEGGTPEELKEYWSILTSELNRQKILMERLLMAGRLESGAMRLDHAPMDLISILEESILAVRPIANKKDISIPLSAPEKPIIVMGDKSGLQQVFINLINNAAKFSPQSSSIDVDVNLTPQEARVSITDHGMGIPPEDVPHLFERFFRGRNVTIAEIPGSGIGLYIVKTIVEELGGSIQVESVLKQGTTIIVTLLRVLDAPVAAVPVPE
jgi:PAS domain S-box-containing protein